jgi:hypothetical protein
MKLVESIKKQVLINSKKREAFLERSSFDEFSISKGADTLLTKENYLSVMYKRFYDKASVSDLYPSEDLNYCESWVPFVKGKTLLGLHNIFQNNYGIKDPIFTRVIIAKDEVITDSFSFILNPKESKLVDVSKYTDIDSGAVLVQCYHPRIKVILDQFRYFGIYTDNSGNLLSGVHSMPFPSNKGYIDNSDPMYRSFSWENESTNYHCFSKDFQPGEIKNPKENFGYFKSDEPIKGPGYLTIKDKDGSFLSIWHDGPSKHVNKFNDYDKDTGDVNTTSFVPNFEKNSPYIFIHRSQIGIPCDNFTVTAFQDDINNPIAKKDFTLEGDYEIINCAEIEEFSSIKGKVNINVSFPIDYSKFSHVPNVYCHFYYTANGVISDQVHSHASIGFQNNPYASLNKFRCNKFAPAVLKEGHDCVYFISNIGPKDNNVAKDLKIRVITDTNRESVTYLPISERGTLDFSISDLDIDSKATYATVIIEDEHTNYNGNWYLINKNTGNVATDHFTGG